MSFIGAYSHEPRLVLAGTAEDVSTRASELITSLSSEMAAGGILFDSSATPRRGRNEMEAEIRALRSRVRDLEDECVELSKNNATLHDEVQDLNQVVSQLTKANSILKNNLQFVKQPKNNSKHGHANFGDGNASAYNYSRSSKSFTSYESNKSSGTHRTGNSSDEVKGSKSTLKKIFFRRNLSHSSTKLAESTPTSSNAGLSEFLDRNFHHTKDVHDVSKDVSMNGGGGLMPKIHNSAEKVVYSGIISASSVPIRNRDKYSSSPPASNTSQGPHANNLSASLPPADGMTLVSSAILGQKSNQLQGQLCSQKVWQHAAGSLAHSSSDIPAALAEFEAATKTAVLVRGSKVAASEVAARDENMILDEKLVKRIASLQDEEDKVSLLRLGACAVPAIQLRGYRVSEHDDDDDTHSSSEDEYTDEGLSGHYQAKNLWPVRKTMALPGTRILEYNRGKQIRFSRGGLLAAMLKDVSEDALTVQCGAEVRYGCGINMPTDAPVSPAFLAGQLTSVLSKSIRKEGTMQKARAITESICEAINLVLTPDLSATSQQGYLDHVSVVCGVSVCRASDSLISLLRSTTQIVRRVTQGQTMSVFEHAAFCGLFSGTKNYRAVQMAHVMVSLLQRTLACFSGSSVGAILDGNLISFLPKPLHGVGMFVANVISPHPQDETLSVLEFAIQRRVPQGYELARESVRSLQALLGALLFFHAGDSGPASPASKPCLSMSALKALDDPQFAAEYAIRAVKNKDYSLLVLLALEGVDLSGFARNGSTPLSASVSLSSPVVTGFLLELGLSPNVVNHLGESVLHEACRDSCLEVVVVLLFAQTPVDVSIVNQNHELPLHLLLKRDFPKKSCQLALQLIRMICEKMKKIPRRVVHPLKSYTSSCIKPNSEYACQIIKILLQYLPCDTRLVRSVCKSMKSSTRIYAILYQWLKEQQQGSSIRTPRRGSSVPHSHSGSNTSAICNEYDPSFDKEKENSGVSKSVSSPTHQGVRPDAGGKQAGKQKLNKNRTQSLVDADSTAFNTLNGDPQEKAHRKSHESSVSPSHSRKFSGMDAVRRAARSLRRSRRMSRSMSTTQEPGKGNSSSPRSPSADPAKSKDQMHSLSSKQKKLLRLRRNSLRGETASRERSVSSACVIASVSSETHHHPDSKYSVSSANEAEYVRSAGEEYSSSDMEQMVSRSESCHSQEAVVYSSEENKYPRASSSLHSVSSNSSSGQDTPGEYPPISLDERKVSVKEKSSSGFELRKRGDDDVDKIDLSPNVCVPSGEALNVQALLSSHKMDKNTDQVVHRLMEAHAGGQSHSRVHLFAGVVLGDASVFRFSCRSRSFEPISVQEISCTSNRKASIVMVDCEEGDIICCVLGRYQPPVPEVARMLEAPTHCKNLQHIPLIGPEATLRALLGDQSSYVSALGFAIGRTAFENANYADFRA